VTFQHGYFSNPTSTLDIGRADPYRQRAKQRSTTNSSDGIQQARNAVRRRFTFNARHGMVCSWTAVGTAVSADYLRSIGEFFVSSGMAAAGYQ
jgi:hypothetical protein